jgi:hypothetical protein
MNEKSLPCRPPERCPELRPRAGELRIGSCRVDRRGEAGDRPALRPARALMRILLLAGLVLVQASTPLAAQASALDWDVRRQLVTRADLQDLISQLAQVANSPAYGAEIRARATQELAIIESRLTLGDFHPGDQILLRIQGEETLSGTFLVGQKREVTLPLLGELPLEGVLRAELEEHVQRHLTRFLREPVVQARSLTRLAVLGEVRQPGFYLVPSEVVLADAIMAAGGPSSAARLDRIRIERGSTDIWSGRPLQEALADGQTLDRMSLRAGDQIIVPQQPPRTGTFPLVQMLITSVPALLVSLFALLGGG